MLIGGWVLVHSHLATGASFILLVSAAIGPFAQQSVKSYACQRPLHNISASVAAANRVDSGLTIGANDFPGLKLTTAAMEGIMGSENNSRTVPFDCPTGVCEFPQYSSLGYCNSCIDITSHVQERYGTVYGGFTWSGTYGLNYTIPGEDCQLSFSVENGELSDFEWQYPNTNTWTQGRTTAHLVLCPSSRFGYFNFTTFFLIWSNCSHDDGSGSQDRAGCSHLPEQLPSLGNSSGLVALSCTLGFCVRDYTGRVRNGVLDETMTNSFPPSFQIHSHEAINHESAILHLPCIIDSKKYDISNVSQVPSVPGRRFTVVILDGHEVTAPLECVFTAGPTVPSGVRKLLQQVFVSQIYGRPSCSSGSKDDSACEPWYLESMFRGGRPTVDTVSLGMDRVAVSISNLMRAVGSNAYRNGSGTALGTVIETTVCLRVDWPWLLLPGVLVLLTVALFVAVLFIDRPCQSGQPIWKSSAVVAFFYGIDARSHAADCADEGAARPEGSACGQGDSQESSQLTGGERHSDLMTLESINARAKKVVVKLNTAGTGRPGFIIVNEEEDAHLEASKLDGQQRPADSHSDGETLPLTRLSRNSSHRGQAPTYLQVDLGMGLTPSIRESLDRSTQCALEASPERES